MSFLLIFTLLLISNVKAESPAFCANGNCNENDINGLEQAPSPLYYSEDQNKQNGSSDFEQSANVVENPKIGDENSANLTEDFVNKSYFSFNQDAPVKNFSDTLNTVLFRHNAVSKNAATFDKPNINIASPNENENEDHQTLRDSVQEKATDFEIRAMLSKCVRTKTSDCDDNFECKKDPRLNKIRTKKQRTRCEEEADDDLLQTCDKKISLTLKVKNVGNTNCKPQYVILDHVFDPVTEQKQKLLNIYVIKISQTPVFQTYDLVFENLVNSQAAEKVVNKNNEGYTGCSTDLNNPTCASASPNIPYSNGFCCSCPNGHSGVDLQDFNRLENTAKTNIQKRGGQDCDDRYTPPDLDESFHQSAHCLDFSDLWYSIYQVSKPSIQHFLRIEIFEKFELRNGKVSWNAVTSCGPILLGTRNSRYVSVDGNILAYYTTDKNSDDIDFALDCKTHKLLIPELSGKEADKNQYPEVLGGPEEYLVVKESDIDLSGRTCNKAGVGYEAFVKQHKRCAQEKNSCLKNQPSDFWKHDHDLEQNGQKGCYFLKYFAALPENPVKDKKCNSSDVSTQTQNKELSMFFTHCYTSVLNINFVADFNAVLRSNALAMITEVYTEALNPSKIILTSKIFNSGLVTSIFNIALSGCPMDVPASFASIASQAVLIPPQQQHVFTLEVHCGMPKKTFFCSLEVLNQKEELIALRRIRFQKNDRCVCVWYCKCTCLSYDYGLKCQPLEIKQYHAAGFQGGMAVPTQVVHYSAFDDTLSIMLHIILFGSLTLLYMGLIKALLGCCILSIGVWGLDKILDVPKKMNQYFEKELRDQKVMYDEEGWPIHPETKKRVNNVAPPTQFCVNLVFFFIFPLAVMWNLFKKVMAAKKSIPEYVDLDICQCKASQINLLNRRSLQKSLSKQNGRGTGSQSNSGNHNGREAGSQNNWDRENGREAGSQNISGKHIGREAAGQNNSGEQNGREADNQNNSGKQKGGEAGSPNNSANDDSFQKSTNKQDSKEIDHFLDSDTKIKKCGFRRKKK